MKMRLRLFQWEENLDHLIWGPPTLPTSSDTEEEDTPVIPLSPHLVEAKGYQKGEVGPSTSPTEIM